MLARGYAGMWLSSLHHARLLLVGPPAPSQAAFPRGSENLFSSAQFGLSAVLFFFFVSQGVYVQDFFFQWFGCIPGMCWDHF